MVVRLISSACCAEADKAAAEAGLEAYRSALGMAGPEQLAAGPLAEGPSMQGSILPPPEALQGRRLRLGKKVFTEELTSNCMFAQPRNICRRLEGQRMCLSM